MPRPSRTKVASTNQRVAPSSSTPITNSEESAKSKDNTASTAAQKPKRGRPPRKAEPEETVAPVDNPTTIANARPGGRFARKMFVTDDGQKSALEALRARRDAALRAKSAKQSPAQPSTSTRRVPMQTAEKLVPKSSTSAPTKTQRTSSSAKSNRPAAERAQPEHITPTRPSSDDDLYGLSPGGQVSMLKMQPRRQSTQQQAPPSALKAQVTPAVETSILALANFKRRPRQPSIIRMVQQTSELGNQSDFEAQLEDTLRDFDEFNPDDESTPLHLNKRKSQGVQTGTSSSCKRKHSDEYENIQVRRSPSLPSSPPTRQYKRSDLRSSASSSPPEHVIPSTEQDMSPQFEQEVHSDTMAPPLSSSQYSSPPKPRDVPSSRHDKRRKTNAGTSGLGSSNAANKRKVLRTTAPTISTATLQSLLPKAPQKKRTKAKLDTFDIPSSDSIETSTSHESGDDELARTSSRWRRRTTAATRTPIGKIDGNRGTNKNAVEATRRSRKPLRITPNAKVRRTYSRAQPAESEKENGDAVVISDNESDISDSEIQGRRNKKQRDSGVVIGGSKELEVARKKFEEVDEWEMEFESVDLVGTSSSSWR